MQFNTLQPSGASEQARLNGKQVNKVPQKKQHLRSLTSHKLSAPAKPLQIRKEDVQRESSLNKNNAFQATGNLAEINEVAKEDNRNR